MNVLINKKPNNIIHLQFVSNKLDQIMQNIQIKNQKFKKFNQMNHQLKR